MTNGMELDWSASMQQSFLFYKVNPRTWLDEEEITTMKSCVITRDSTEETLGSATFEGDELSGEFYIRTYLLAIQNQKPYKIPLGTHLVQTSFSGYDGKQKTLSMQAYTPLIELKEKHPPIGYTVLKDEDILDRVYQLTRNNTRCPVIKNENVTQKVSSPGGFVSDLEDTWMSYLAALLANAKFEYHLDARGVITIAPIPKVGSLRAVYTYRDDNSSILYPDIQMDYDLYNIPNVAEVIISNANEYYVSRVVNDDPISEISTVNRGREIVYRTYNPDDVKTMDFKSVIGKKYIDEYTESLLKNLSTIERSITYKHGYCPVRVGDCVELDYKRSGISGIKAMVVSQSIECIPGCPVTEKAVYTEKLWK